MKIRNHQGKQIEGKIIQKVILVMERKNQKKNLNYLLKVKIEPLILTIQIIMKLNY